TLRQVAAALGDRFELERELGRGGSATAWLAHERKHGRRVVLKVLDPSVARLWGADRFAREVRIAARLAHPHIVGLIDSGAEGDLYWYAMPYLEGETLRARLERGPVPPLEAAGLLRDVADALGFAHRAGVVHRDLKPENVLLAGQHAYLLDFGVAKLLPTHGSDGHVSLQGAALGTLAYMAPEQLRADPDADHRVDLYAWGLLAWEMVTGRLPEARGVVGHAAGEPLDAFHPGVPPALAGLVGRCLDPDPEARPASADELVSGVDGAMERRPAAPSPRRSVRVAVVGVAVTVLLALAALLLLRPSGGPAPAGVGVPAPIAVAALSNETGDPGLDTWGRMAGDWLTQGLQSTGLLAVVPWPASLEASERLAAERRAGRPASAVTLLREETGARTVVTGAYYLAGDSLQFQVEVTDAERGRTLASLPPIVVGRDSAHIGIRALRDRVMGTIALQFDERFAPAGQVPVRTPPTYEAYQQFDRGLRRFNAQDYRGALPEFLAARRLDSAWAPPLLYAASAAWNTGEYATVDSLLQALERVKGTLAESERWSADAMRLELAGDGGASREALRRAAELSPSGREWYTFARLALQTDRPRDALDGLLRVDPDRGLLRGWSSYWTQLAHAQHLLGRHEDELASARALRLRFPDRRVGLTLEVRALAALGRVAAIDSALAADAALPPTTYWSQGGAMVVGAEELWAHGREAEGRALLRRAMAWLAGQRAANPDHDAHRYWQADAHYALGEWADAERIFDGLAGEFPDILLYRGSAAAAAAHLGEREAERRLGPVDPRLRGEHTFYRGRLAAIRGERVLAAALFGDAVRDGVSGLPWIHAYARPDLVELGPVRESLPRSLRAGVPGAAGGAP
ncbi:MAG TPA: serine/threonine-protein kinase, partial [Gemmatimonadales bacterium]|nr:serine/threonine-protein kinase [Gemmatimonadales bacterium]